MRYMQNGGFQNNQLMKLTLLMSLLLLLIFWISNFGMYFARMDLSPKTVQDYYIGSEEQFKMPRTYQSMLEVSHMHLPMMALVVLLLTHLLIFAPLQTKHKVAIIITAFLSATVNEVSGWLVRFVHPDFAILKICAFLTFQTVMGLLLFTLIIFMTCNPKSNPHNGAPHKDSDRREKIHKPVQQD